MLIGPLEKSSIFNEFVKWLAIDVEVLDNAAVEAKASENFHYASFTLRRYQSL